MNIVDPAMQAETLTAVSALLYYFGHGHVLQVVASYLAAAFFGEVLHYSHLDIFIF
ncbi:hypothetical protein FIU95_00575 [Microbulbifer sp. THAF38]|nr:hypothetical protein FIU95_00575 [Microbulbifer sp. THAF38]